MRRLYGRISSINVQKVAWALAEMNLDFDWVVKDGWNGRQQIYGVPHVQYFGG